MNKENMEKWLVDLETTSEPQTKSVLHDGYGYCCLGRLCEVAIDNDVQLCVSDGIDGTTITYDGHVAMPPQRVYDWLGDDIPFHLGDCTELNDSLNLSFPEIAKRIRIAIDPESDEGLIP